MNFDRIIPAADHTELPSGETAELSGQSLPHNSDCEQTSGELDDDSREKENPRRKNRAASFWKLRVQPGLTRFQNWLRSPQGRKKMTRILVLVGLVSMFLLGRQVLFSASADASYKDAQSLAYTRKERSKKLTLPAKASQPNTWVPAPVEDDDPNLETMYKVNLEALREVNPDVIGWIMIPDTRINYPIAYSEDSEYYLNHTWDNKENAVGAIYLETRNSTDFTDFNSIVYGHNRTDGSMFADLRRFASKWNVDRSPYVYIALDSGIYRYEIFSAYRAPTDSITYGLSFNEAKTRANFLIYAKENAQVKNDVYPDLTDRILTLSTCSGAGSSNRWVVPARLKMMLVV